MSKKNLLVVCSHPDDEVLGCGATLSKFNKIYNVHCLYLTNGGTNRPNSAIKKNIKSIKRVKKIIGINQTYNGGLPDNEIDKVSLLSVVKIIENIVKKVKPELIFTHTNKDLNIDHQICNKALITACRPTNTNNFLKKIFFFEILSSTEWNFKSDKFSPEIFVKISKLHLKAKIKAMKQYSAELKKFPHPRSLSNIENLAKIRGSHVGFHYAEAFELGYEKID